MSTVTIRKSGNAQIVSLPKALLEQIGASIGDTLSVELQDDTILLRRQIPNRNPALQAELERMFDGVTPDMFQTPEDIEWMEMPSVGSELL